MEKRRKKTERRTQSEDTEMLTEMGRDGDGQGGDRERAHFQLGLEAAHKVQRRRGCGAETYRERVTAAKKGGGVTWGAQDAAGPTAPGKGPLSGALRSAKVEERGLNPMVLGYLLWAAPGSRYILIHAV